MAKPTVQQGVLGIFDGKYGSGEGAALRDAVVRG